jgi:hypothetical protein
MEFCGSARTNGLTLKGELQEFSLRLGEHKSQRYMEEKGTRERPLTWVECHGGETLGE